MEILLVEPNYSNKYPPLGLMKISTYHKSKGDSVTFVKGIYKSVVDKNWDRIYISTLFTFYYAITLRTIVSYKNSTKDPKNIYIGGPMASVMRNELMSEINIKDITIISGLIDIPGILGDDDIIVDDLLPDYSIILTQNETFSYIYPVKNDFLIHATHGCIRKCSFCAVPIIEPVFKDYTSIKCKVSNIQKKYGDKRNMMIMDNNILASKYLNEIISDLEEIGYGRENKSYKNQKNGRMLKRYVDFNQGLDARLLAADTNIMKKLSRLSIKPLRVAFDHASLEFVNIYKSVMNQAAENNIANCSNYILFNHEDSPVDLYTRLRINVDLNVRFSSEEYKTEIWSFPMKFSPIFGDCSRNRKHIGPKWNRKYLRAIQCILIPTHGVVGPKIDYFNHAFGENEQEFIDILTLPESYIINRNFHTNNGDIEFILKCLRNLKKDEMEAFKELILDGNKRELKNALKKSAYSSNLFEVLEHYT